MIPYKRLARKIMKIYDGGGAGPFTPLGHAPQQG
jgi:hypothetical protein